jgi:hypothetical protein
MSKSSCFWCAKGRSSICSIVLWVRSGCPSVWEWNELEMFNLVCQNAEIHLGARSEIMVRQHDVVAVNIV